MTTHSGPAFFVSALLPFRNSLTSWTLRHGFTPLFTLVLPCAAACRITPTPDLEIRDRISLARAGEATPTRGLRRSPGPRSPDEFDEFLRASQPRNADLRSNSLLMDSFSFRLFWLTRVPVPGSHLSITSTSLVSLTWLSFAAQILSIPLLVFASLSFDLFSSLSRFGLSSIFLAASDHRIRTTTHRATYSGVKDSRRRDTTAFPSTKRRPSRRPIRCFRCQAV